MSGRSGLCVLCGRQVHSGPWTSGNATTLYIREGAGGYTALLLLCEACLSEPQVQRRKVG